MTSALTQTRWTYQLMQEKLPPETQAEVIANQLSMSPAPTPDHQHLLKKIFRLLDAFVESKGIREVNIAPYDVILDQDNVVQPDIFFVSAVKQSKITARGLEVAPDLIVEIVSPSSFFRDTVQKKDLYEQFGVQEYWIADPANQVIEIFALADQKYQLHGFMAEKGSISSALLTGFTIHSEAIFKRNKK